MSSGVEAGAAAGAERVTVYGHARAKSTLRGEQRLGRGAQAYLLSGPPLVGKRTMARWFAQILLCGAPLETERPCGRCRACRLVRAGTFPDLHVIDPPLRVESVRELGRLLVLAPAESRHRVVLLPNVEEASTGAANSLLKTLEEPPDHAVLMLTTGDAGSVLPTIRSRCRVMSLRPLGAAEATAALIEQKGLPEPQAALLARLSGGCLGWAERAARDADTGGARGRWLDALAEVMGSARHDRFARAADLVSGGDVFEGLSVWQSWWRDLLLLLHGLEEPIVNRDRTPELRAAAKRYGVPDAVRAARALDDVLRRLSVNANPRLALEVLLLELPA